MNDILIKTIRKKIVQTSLPSVFSVYSRIDCEIVYNADDLSSLNQLDEWISPKNINSALQTGIRFNGKKFIIISHEILENDVLFVHAKMRDEGYLLFVSSTILLLIHYFDEVVPLQYSKIIESLKDNLPNLIY